MLQIPLVSLALFLVAIVTLGLAIYALLNINVRGASPFCFLMVAFTFYIAGFAMELMTPTASGIIFWLKVEYLGIATLPCMCLLLAIRLTGEDRWLQWWPLKLYLLFPLITLFIYYTNSWHHLFYKSFGAICQVYTYYELVIDKGPWYYVNIVYLNLSMLISVILFTRKLKKDVVERQQSWILIIGASGPWIAHLIYLSGLTKGFDISPFGFLLTAPLFAWGVFRNYMVFLIPKARNYLYQSLVDAVLIIDNNKNLIDFNKTAGTLFKTLNRSVIGKPVSEFFTENPEVNELIESPEIQRTQVKLILGNVKRSFILTNSDVTSRADFKLGNIIMMHEITDQMFLLDNLRESEEKYRLIFENTPVGVFQYDISGKITTCNDAFVKLIGSSRKILIGFDINKLPDKVMVKTILDSLHGEVGYYEHEYESFTADKITPIRGLFAPISSKEGAIRSGVGIVEDISAKHLVEKQLKYREEFESILMTLELDFLNTEISEIPHVFNECLMRLGTFCKVDRAYVFCIDQAKGIMQITHEWQSPGLNPELMELKSLTISTIPRLMKDLYDCEIIYLPDLSLIPPDWDDERKLLELYDIQSMIVVPLKFGGELLGFAGFDSIREPRKWNKDEISLLKVLGQIFASVLKRQDANEQLISAKEKAEEASTAKSIFLANMSHEIRTPLNGILGVAEMMRKESEYPGIHKYSDIILTSGNRLLQTLSQILDLSRVESGKMELEIEPVNVDQAIDDVISQYINAARQKNLFMERQHGGEHFILNLDDQLFRNCLSNLINNAIKFTSQGGITISTAIEIVKDRKYAIIRVSDTGIGISEKNLVSIFEDFKQVSEGAKKEYEGAGLGLSLTKSFVELSGGTVRVESVHGFGATFILSYPAPVKE
ncbi:MAG: histidine kinase N-terminal 7TM domain-containing protein [Bacteroidales bacterium]|nr:histidine kinase N-terminal 7TM domain-containing protein [Bacteroidales bacterium]